MNKWIRCILYALLDCFITAFSFVFALILSNTDFNAVFYDEWYFLVISLALILVLGMSFGLYTKILRYIDVKDTLKIGLAITVMIVYFAVATVISSTLSVEWFMVSTLLFVPIYGVSRFAHRTIAFLARLARKSSEIKTGTRVMIIGAGDAGSSIIKEITSTENINLNPVCALDDDPHKQGLEINGVKIVGKLQDVEKCAKDYNVQEIIITIPALSKKRLKELIALCQKTQCAIKVLPSIYQFANGDVSVSDVKDVDVSDLLGREQVKVDIGEIIGYIKDKVVLVTGGGGSIGSELCRQIAEHSPKRLVIIDIYENNAYDIEQELKRKFPDLSLKVLIASIRDTKRIDCIFNEYKPEIVFHAAAHKHVPLMEFSPNEAVKNNIGGTYKVADAAGRYGVKRFVMISTDKAVNPTNVMGATKRVCEMIIQAMDKKYDTEYVAVRFGNVLGSNGSVIPLFKRQIKEGGPVTVTHKDIVRYFMTIPEAVTLILQAGAYAKGGEIFVLDMGEPVRIYDLAVNLIKLSGLEPYKDIDILITGLRPGEKLYEERLMAEEGLNKTANERISIGKPLDFDGETLFKDVQDLCAFAYNETTEMKVLLSKLVPTYKITE